MPDIIRRQAGEPPNEIEITPEMIEAGAERFSEIEGLYPPEDLVLEVFRVMWLAREGDSPSSASGDGASYR